MKKVLILFVLIMCCFVQPASAATIRVQALSDFTTENPPEYFSVKTLDDLSFDEETLVKSGCVIKGQIVDVKSPKRLKRNANFKFVPLSYKDESGKVVEINGYYPAKYTTKFKKGEFAKSAALTVGNYFVKGLSMGYSAIEGAVKNEKDNRFKSSVNAVSEDSPFSYIEKGGEIVIPKDQVFLLNFKAKNEPEEDDEEPNYEYKELTPNVNPQTQKGYKNNTDSIPSEVNPELLKDTNSIRTEN